MLIWLCMSARPKGPSPFSNSASASNHRMDETESGDPDAGNRFEVLECQAAIDANYVRRTGTHLRR